MPADEIGKELLEKLHEMADATLNTEEFLATHLHELDYGQDNAIFKKIYEHLAMLRGHPSWNNFRRPLVSAPSSNWQIALPLSQLAPKKDEIVWLLVELPLLSLWPVFEGEIESVETVINQCRLLEYYVVSKDFTWVIAKSRHDEIFVNGDEVERSLMKLNDPGRKLE